MLEALGGGAVEMEPTHHVFNKGPFAIRGNPKFIPKIFCVETTPKKVIKGFNYPMTNGTAVIKGKTPRTQHFASENTIIDAQP